MAISYGPSIVTSGLILCLDSENPRSWPGSGTTWYDISGNANHFTLSGSLTYVSKLGFTGYSVNNTWYRNNWPANLKVSQGGNGLTTCVWAVSSATTGNYQKLIGNSDTDNYIDLYVYPSGVYQQEDYSLIYINDGRLVNNGSFQASDGVYRMYSSTNDNGRITTNPVYPFSIGNEGTVVQSYPWNGYISVVMMYNRQLSTVEIAQNYTAFAGRYNT